MIIVLVIGIAIGYFVGKSGIINQSLQGSSAPQGIINNQSIQPTVSVQPAQIVDGAALSISTSGNGGSATIKTSDTTQMNITWTNSDVPNPSAYLDRLCLWKLSGTTLISVTNCSE